VIALQTDLMHWSKDFPFLEHFRELCSGIFGEEWTLDPTG